MTSKGAETNPDINTSSQKSCQKERIQNAGTFPTGTLRCVSGILLISMTVSQPFRYKAPLSLLGKLGNICGLCMRPWAQFPSSELIAYLRPSRLFPHQHQMCTLGLRLGSHRVCPGETEGQKEESCEGRDGLEVAHWDAPPERYLVLSHYNPHHCFTHFPLLGELPYVGQVKLIVLKQTGHLIIVPVARLVSHWHTLTLPFYRSLAKIPGLAFALLPFPPS